MKTRDIDDVEDCMYKIEALLKEYNCEIVVDQELDRDVILVDKDNNRFELLVKMKGCNMFKSELKEMIRLAYLAGVEDQYNMNDSSGPRASSERAEELIQEFEDNGELTETLG